MALFLPWSAGHAQSVAPYFPDPDTVCLFHFDQPAGTSTATSSEALGRNAYTVQNSTAGNGLVTPPLVTSMLGATAYTNFGNSAVITTPGYLIGCDGNGSGAYQGDVSGSTLSPDAVPMNSLGIGNGGQSPFTIEALIFPSATNANQEIVCTDSSGGSRGFQFRIKSTGELEFNAITAGADVLASIPSSGVHAFVADAWFHAAATYDGTTVRLYWTRLDASSSQPNLIGSTGAAIGTTQGAAAGPLVIGNENRNSSGEVFQGRIDEVRISKVARKTNEFVFRSVSVLEATGTQLPNVPENTLDGNLATRWSAQFDGQYITYDLSRPELVESIDIAFYQPGGVRTNYFEVLESIDNVSWRPALTNASGTNVMLLNFDLPDWPARYVRIVGHLNSENDFNSITEVVIHRSLLADIDSDGLPDVWENYYFGNLSQNGAGDPDADTQSNAFEYQHGADPTQYNSPVDSDGDGLSDTWESIWFGNLNQTASGDPDRDGVSNLAEYQDGCNPTNPNSVPGDTDGDSLPDSWEVANLGGLSYNAYDDPDNDGYNNVAEQVAATDPLNAESHPSWSSPRVAFLHDSIVATNACLMPNGSTYGRAINGISFQTEILLTFDGYEYTAWYDTMGTTQKVWLARRTINGTSVGAWEKVQTDSELLNGDESNWDAHNVISLGISPVDGTLHFSWDMHDNTLRYRRSVGGLCTTNKSAWGVAMLNAEQNWLVASGQTITVVSYPRFINTPAGGLMFQYRTGNTSAGDHWLHNYNPAAGNWSAGWKFSAKEGTYTGVLANGSTGSSTSRNAYENGFDFAPDGTLHHTWTYREAADSANHDIFYAYSTDGGVTWRNNAGSIIADSSLGQALRVDSPDINVKVLDSRQLLINQQAQCVDNYGCVHVLMLHRRPEPGFEWHSGDPTFSTVDTAYYHYFRDPTTGVWSQRRIPPDTFPVGARPKIGFDAQANVYAVYLSYANTNVSVVPGYAPGRLVIASASKASQYTDWEVVQSLAVSFNGEPLIDRSRLLTDNIMSVFIQEDSATTSVVGTPLHVFDFAVGVSKPAPVSLNFSGQHTLIVVQGAPGYSYQLFKATALAPPDWNNIGTPVAGFGSLLALPDPNGRAATQRFYKVLRTP